MTRPLRALLQVLPRRWGRWFRRPARPLLGTATLSMAIAVSVVAAERLRVFVPPLLSFPLSVGSLETFAQTGELPRDLAAYARFLSPEELALARSLLQRDLALSPEVMVRLTEAPLGEAVLKELGRVVRTESGQSGFSALRAAVVLAAVEGEGQFDALDLLRQYPLREIRIDAGQAFQSARFRRRQARDREAALAHVRDRARQEAAAGPEADPATLADLQAPGPYPWLMEVTSFVNPARGDRPLRAVLYWPSRRAPRPLPLVLVSHGFASNPEVLTYLSEHWVSYGYAVAAVEHPHTSVRSLLDFFAGEARSLEPTDLALRASDLSALLDRLESRRHWQRRLDFDRVAAVGHSLGGATVLALAGAGPSAAQRAAACGTLADLPPFGDPTLLTQCATLLPPAGNGAARDDRLRAAIAISPVGRASYGPEDLAALSLPLMVVSGSRDRIAEPLNEQVRPFSALTARDRYLMLVDPATHFSTLDNLAVSLPPEIVGPVPDALHPTVAAAGLAFLQKHLRDPAQLETPPPCLDAACVAALSPGPFSLHLTRSLPAAELEAAIDAGP